MGKDQHHPNDFVYGPGARSDGLMRHRLRGRMIRMPYKNREIKEMPFYFFRAFIFTAFLFLYPSSTAMGESVTMVTNIGKINVLLFDDIAPVTVANFMNYIREGKYRNTLIHRSVPGFVIQGGGYVLDGSTIYTVQKNAPIVNEFHLSNLRGTIAMAKLAGNPDSATSEWFFNLGDNSENLDYQNGGFTVFGRVTDQSLAVIDAIAALPIYDLSNNWGPAFSQLPLVNAQSLVIVTDMIYAGDINNDKSVDLADAICGLQMIAGKTGLTVSLDAEINNDGRIGVEEVIYILQKLSRLRPDTP
jgi:cyclophilin family peptidyl-prolyl cis-trans isomerase